MNLNLKTELLDQIYHLFDDFISTQDMACNRQCATCCTCNMTLTTLEGYKMLSRLDARSKSTLLQPLYDAAEQRRFKPQITTNEMARLCMTGQEIPEEIVDPSWGPCPLLSDKECPVYGLRPFGCRCMVSKAVCAGTGYADIDDLTLTVANLFNQFIEHLDQDGMTGNLIDVLLYLDHDKHLTATPSEKKDLLKKGLIPNRPIPVLMIPPEHREQMGPLLESLKKVLEGLT